MINSLQGQRVGILAFSGKPFYYCPFTSDYGGFLEFLNALNSHTIPFWGSELDEVYQKANSILKNKSLASKIVLFFSDGEFHSDLPDEILTDSFGNQVPVLTVGVGSASGGKVSYRTPYEDSPAQQLIIDDKPVISKINEEALKKLAAKSSGVYINISENYQTVLEISSMIKETEKTQAGKTREQSSISKAWLFLWFPVLILSASIFLSILRIGSEKR